MALTLAERLSLHVKLLMCALSAHRMRGLTIAGEKLIFANASELAIFTFASFLAPQLLVAA